MIEKEPHYFVNYFEQVKLTVDIVIHEIMASKDIYSKL